LIAGLAVGAAAYAARAAVEIVHGWKAAGPRMRQFYKGGFLQDMTKREAAQILGALSDHSSGQTNVLCVEVV